MISVLQRANKYKPYSRLWSNWSRIQIPRKRIKDKDAKVIATVAVSRSTTTTDTKAVGRKQQGRDDGEQRQYANTAAASGQKYGKSGPKFNKAGPSDESGGENTRHYTHLASVINMFSDLVSERREPNIDRDGGKMLRSRSRDQMQVTTSNH